MIDDELKQAIQKRNLILFIGAGVSATLNFPTWSKLLDRMGEELGFDTELFRRCGDSLMLAEYYSLVKGRLPKLNELLSTEKENVENGLRSSPIYEAIVKLDCPIIYTTNYDHLIETAYELHQKSYKRIVDVNDLVNLSPAETQIVKFHGDLTVNDSIVLTESSYFERLNFESPMDIKLRSDMLGKAILFLGYSLSDINIRLLIYKLDQLWKKGNLTKRPKSYIFLPTPNEVQERILESRGIVPIVGENLDKTASMKHFLQELCS